MFLEQKASSKKDITSHIDLDFGLNIHYAEKKIDLLSMVFGTHTKDESSIGIMPSGNFTVRLKFNGSIAKNVVVKAMNILTLPNDKTKKEEEESKDVTVEGEFEVEGNIVLETRFYFDKKGKPCHEVKVAFLGLGGEYKYKMKKKQKKGKDEVEEITNESSPTPFILMEPFEFKFNTLNILQNPSEK